MRHPLGGRCRPARAAMVDLGGSTHGMRSPVGDDRPPATAPDSTPVTTKHPPRDGGSVFAARPGGGEQPEEARHRLDTGLQLAEDTGMHFYDAELLRLRAHTHIDPDVRQADIGAALELAHRQGATLFELRSALDDFELRGPPAHAALGEVTHDLFGEERIRRAQRNRWNRDRRRRPRPRHYPSAGPLRARKYLQRSANVKLACHDDYIDSASDDANDASAHVPASGQSPCGSRPSQSSQASWRRSRGAMMRRRSASNNSSVDTCDRAFGLVGRSAYPWDEALGLLRRGVDTSSFGSPPARTVSMLPGAQDSLFSSMA